MSSLALFADHGIFLFRWLHFFFGVIWIGMLYYFNFVQVPFFGETDAATKSNAIQKLVPRALWWFRWGAMFTFLTGFVLLYLTVLSSPAGMGYFATSWGVLILIGTLLGITMFLNVWLIIWPKQKIVIASTEAVAKGGAANPDAAAAGARALCASRTNTLFSIPLLFFMGAASHLPVTVAEGVSFGCLIISTLIVWGLIELNAIFGKASGPLKSVVGVIHAGLALTVVLYGIVEFCL